MDLNVRKMVRVKKYRLKSSVILILFLLQHCTGDDGLLLNSPGIPQRLSRFGPSRLISDIDSDYILTANGIVGTTSLDDVSAITTGLGAGLGGVTGSGLVGAATGGGGLVGLAGGGVGGVGGAQTVVIGVNQLGVGGNNILTGPIRVKEKIGGTSYVGPRLTYVRPPRYTNLGIRMPRRRKSRRRYLMGRRYGLFG